MKPEDGLDPLQDAAIVQPRELWDKKPDESQRAFDAFCRYRDAEKRSFKAIANSLNCSTQNVWQWSTRHNWKLRCDAYDMELDRQQRVEFARNRVRMKDRHLRLAVAIGGIAAHAVREWQARIASGAALDLAPEQVAMLVKCSAELERSTIGVDGENRPPVINVLFGVHKYADEKAGDSGDVEGEVEWKLQEDVEREEYEMLNDDERRIWESWKNPPRKKLTN